MVTDNYIYIACVQKFIVDIDMTMHGHDTTGSSTEQKKDLFLTSSNYLQVTTYIRSKVTTACIIMQDQHQNNCTKALPHIPT